MKQTYRSQRCLLLQGMGTRQQKKTHLDYGQSDHQQVHRRLCHNEFVHYDFSCTTQPDHAHQER